MINPAFVQIIDAGSIPMFNSISRIIMHMESFQNVGGACGEIEVMIPDKKENGEALSFFENVIALAQYVEYKISHYLDKATESLFGFVSVLPGAFSTFRWQCIKDGPLEAFLKGAKGTKEELAFNCFSANMYLAEDRIMCHEIICKPKESYILNYVSNALCLTDPPLTLTELIKQRRRWFNGSFFAALHVISCMCNVWKRKKTLFELCRILLLILYFFYMFTNMLLSYILVGSFYAAFSIFVRSILPFSNCFDVTKTANILENFYLFCLFIILMLSTTVKIQWAEGFFKFASVMMGILTLFIICFTIYSLFVLNINLLSLIFIIVLFCSYCIPLIFNHKNIELGNFLKGIVYVVYLTPTYINIITIYSFSNISDISWGSRPAGDFKATESEEKVKKKEDEFKNYRSWFLIIWLILNTGVGYVITLIQRNMYLPMFITVIGYCIISILSIKLLCSTAFWFMNICEEIKIKFTETKLRKVATNLENSKITTNDANHYINNSNSDNNSDDIENIEELSYSVLHNSIIPSNFNCYNERNISIIKAIKDCSRKENNKSCDLN